MLNALKFDILANDKTGQAFASVRRSLRGTEGALAGFQERAGRVGRKLSLVGAAASVAITAPVTAFLQGNIRLFNEQAKAEAAVRQAVKSTGGAAGLTAAELGKMASALQGITTFGDEQILTDVTAPLLTFTKVSGQTFATAQGLVLDMATLLKTDLKSAALQVGKALNDPVKGVTALGRAGVQFSEDQKKVIESLVETGDVAAAQAVILTELQTQFGGQATEAAKTTEGQLTQAGNAWGDFREQLGKVESEIIPPLAAGLKTVAGVLQELSPGTKKFLVVGLGLAAVIGPLVGIVGALALAIGAISAPVLAVIGAVVGLTAAVAAFWPQIVGAYDAVKGALTSLVEFIDQPLEDIVAQSKDYLVDQLGSVWADMRAGLMVVREGFVAVFGEETVSTFEQFNLQLLSLSEDLIVGLHGSLVDGVAGIVTDFNGSIDGAVAFFRAFNEQMLELAQALIEGLQQWLIGGVQKITDQVIGSLKLIEAGFAGLYDVVVGNSIVPDMVTEVGDWFETMGTSMVSSSEGARVGVLTAFGSIATGISGPFQNALATSAASFNSFTNGLAVSAEGMAATAVGVSDQMQSVFSDVAGAITGPFQEALTSGKLSFKSFAAGLIQAANNLADQLINNAFSQINEALTGLLSGVFSGGSLFGGSGGSLFGSSGGSLFGSSSFGGTVPALGSLPLVGSFGSGGSFTVGGAGGVDRNLVAFRASRGEQVEITPPGEAGRQRGPVFGSVTFNISAPDEATGRKAAGSVQRRLAQMARKGQGYL